jgi:hypothetical protein
MLLSHLPFYHCVCYILTAQFYCHTYHFIVEPVTYTLFNVTVILTILSLSQLHAHCSMLLSYLPFYHCACYVHTAQCNCHTYHFITVSVTYIPLNVTVIPTILSLFLLHTYQMLPSYLPFYHCACYVHTAECYGHT